MKIEGLEVNITVGTFAEAMTLKKAVADALKSNGIKIDLSGFKIDLDDVDNMKFGDIGGILELIMSVATDGKVRDALFALGGRCTVGSGEDKVKVTQELFDPSENRHLYYPLMIEIARENLSPFFKFRNGLSSILSGLNLKSLKSK